MSDCGVDDFWGEDALLFERVLRSARLDELEETELLCDGGAGWRARESRRGEVAPLGIADSDLAVLA